MYYVSKKGLSLGFCLAVFMALLVMSATAWSASGLPYNKVALIIDDVGYNYALGLRALDLPGEVTYSFIAKAPAASKLARRARAQGREMMLHLPMQSHELRKLDEGALLAGMSVAEIDALLAEQLVLISGAKGVNNHMGSKLTESQPDMQHLMLALKKHDLYFVDSRTSPASVALQEAESIDLPSASRQIFLDHEPGNMAEQWSKAMNIAREQGSVVVIAHPHIATLAFLEVNLKPTLRASRAKLVPVSVILSER